MCGDAQNEIINAEEALGFRVHEVEEPTCEIDSLGFSIDGRKGRLRAYATKSARLRRVLLWGANGGRMSGEQLEKLIGHCTFEMLVRRPLLSILSAVYVFMRQRYHVCCKPWAAVKWELYLLYALLPFAYADMRREWLPDAFSFDASLDGFGVARLESSASDVEESAGMMNGGASNMCIIKSLRVSSRIFILIHLRI